MPGFDPAMGEKHESSSAKVLMANIAVTDKSGLQLRVIFS
jgi:hypothetical protein